MSIRPASIDYRNKQYKAESTWTLTPAQRPIRGILATPKQSIHHSFVLARSSGLMVCEDYQISNVLSDIETRDMQLTSVDYSSSTNQVAAFSFSTGHILLMNPGLRKRGKLVWLNSKKNIYSKKPPSTCRWINDQQFVVLFGDNLMWKFDIRLEGEDTKFILAAQNNTRDSQSKISVITHPSPEANPIAMWKLQLGKLRDIQVCPKPRQNLLCLNAGNELKIMNTVSHEVEVILKSYFAGFQCICWSDDGKLLVAGGEDDCVHIWSGLNWDFLYKGAGHNSWVSGVTFGLVEAEYVLVSVGQDGKLCIWELTLGDCQERNREKGEAVVIQYPRKNNQQVIQPVYELNASEEPLIYVSCTNNNIFACDILSNVHQWVSQ